MQEAERRYLRGNGGAIVPLRKKVLQASRECNAVQTIPHHILLILSQQFDGTDSFSQEGHLLWPLWSEE